ncbi:hypothetical protein RFM68_21175 [Mesorhizobium sp. MSK_1335]|uniref:Uncharacterized protein n=1 Tax=Mesorhizobium montanum TaxID=3072323 RepID=A0ABU4ZPT5_9HYPH|nr:hypothetical protein [Mesorhizobium sp. MSK_1335]MDX8527017.1 hypothetical protein [Mesorhizobium sp. MSK_1335]
MKPSRQRPAERRLHPNQASIAELGPQFESMIDRAIRAIVSCDPKPDAIFGGYSEFVSVARSVAFHEGKLLEWGIAAIARCNPDLLVLPADRPMPVVPAALELLKRNEWTDIQGIRLPSEVHTTKTYTQTCSLPIDNVMRD